MKTNMIKINDKIIARRDVENMACAAFIDVEIALDNGKYIMLAADNYSVDNNNEATVTVVLNNRSQIDDEIIQFFEHSGLKDIAIPNIFEKDHNFKKILAEDTKVPDFVKENLDLVAEGMKEVKNFFNEYCEPEDDEEDE